MKKAEFGYTKDWRANPMAYWVHVEKDSKPWYKSEEFSPPAPNKIGNLGFPTLTIEFDGQIFQFTSKAQYEEFIRVMSKKLLPSTMELSGKRAGNMGPNSHWLSRLPAKAKPWRYREKLIKYCRKIDFKEE